MGAKDLAAFADDDLHAAAGVALSNGAVIVIKTEAGHGDLVAEPLTRRSLARVPPGHLHP